MSDLELRFHIHAFTRATIPLARLSEYLRDLATILGEEHSVHFERIEDGSAVPVIRVAREAEPKVINNAHRAEVGEGSEAVRKAKRKLERRLAADNAKGAEVIDSLRGFKLLRFRGREDIQEPWGPVRQSGELIGTVIAIGGQNDPVPVHLRDGNRTYNCEAKVEVARQLRPYLLEPQAIRVSGYGKWNRDDQGQWRMEEFRIHAFEPLDNAALADVLGDLRAIKSKWLQGDDPIAELRKLTDL